MLTRGRSGAFGGGFVSAPENLEAAFAQCREDALAHAPKLAETRDEEQLLIAKLSGRRDTDAAQAMQLLGSAADGRVEAP